MAAELLARQAIVGRGFKDSWSTPSDLAVVDELVAPDVLLQYPPEQPAATGFGALLSAPIGVPPLPDA
ncbi:MAG: hypothetical protein HIU82_04680 [Proteobacteria bacterium]|nr:hypothetical protein [Pseudomonadota bacterium]